MLSLDHKKKNKQTNETNEGKKITIQKCGKSMANNPLLRRRSNTRNNKKTATSENKKKEEINNYTIIR